MVEHFLAPRNNAKATWWRKTTECLISTATQVMALEIQLISGKNKNFPPFKLYYAIRVIFKSCETIIARHFICSNRGYMLLLIVLPLQNTHFKCGHYTVQHYVWIPNPWLPVSRRFPTAVTLQWKGAKFSGTLSTWNKGSSHTRKLRKFVEWGQTKEGGRQHLHMLLPLMCSKFKLVISAPFC